MIHTRREVEAKFRLKNENDVKSAASRLLSFGFIPKPERMELDYSLDTPEWTCRLNGLILRFRRVIEKDQSPYILLTLKEKRQRGTYQDYSETELRLGSDEHQAFNYIQSVLKEVVGLELPAEIAQLTDFEDIIVSARSAGYTRHRILLEKKRQEFSQTTDQINVTIDSFPDGMGTYLEVEAHDPKALTKWIKKLKLAEFEPEPLNYGEILKRHNQEQTSEVLQRTAVFDPKIRELISNL